MRELGARGIERGSSGGGPGRTRAATARQGDGGGCAGARAAARQSGLAVASRRRRWGASTARGPGDPRKRGGVARDRAEAARGGRSGAMAPSAAFRRRWR